MNTATATSDSTTKTDGEAKVATDLGEKIHEAGVLLAGRIWKGEINTEGGAHHTAIDLATKLGTGVSPSQIRLAGRAAMNAEHKAEIITLQRTPIVSFNAAMKWLMRVD